MTVAGKRLWLLSAGISVTSTVGQCFCCSDIARCSQRGHSGVVQHSHRQSNWKTSQYWPACRTLLAAFLHRCHTAGCSKHLTLVLEGVLRDCLPAWLWEALATLTPQKMTTWRAGEDFDTAEDDYVRDTWCGEARETDDVVLRNLAQNVIH